jgi:hypothetical protein
MAPTIPSMFSRRNHNARSHCIKPSKSRPMQRCAPSKSRESVASIYPRGRYLCILEGATVAFDCRATCICAPIYKVCFVGDIPICLSHRVLLLILQGLKHFSDVENAQPLLSRALIFLQGLTKGAQGPPCCETLPHDAIPSSVRVGVGVVAR